MLEATNFAKKIRPNEHKNVIDSLGVIIGDNVGEMGKQFIATISQHRFGKEKKSEKFQHNRYSFHR